MLEMQLALELGVLDLDDGVLHAESGTRSLTNTEVALLRYLVQVKRPVDKTELLKRVWNYHPGVQSRTVAVTINRLRAKLEREPGEPVHLVTVDGKYHLVAEPSSPLEPSPDLIGRDAAFATLRAALSGGVRVLTVVGPMGVGKSRLARELADVCRGAMVISLDGATDQGDVVQRCAMALGGTAKGESLEPITNTRPFGLVVLDDVDGVHRVVCELAREWLEATLVVTARAPLRVEGEVIYEVEPLDPDAAEALLLRRWQAERLGAPPDLTSISARLDGLPLSIELAATWAGTLSAPELADRLAHSTLWLEDLTDTHPGRHRSLEFVIDQIWARLTDEDRQLLAELLVFKSDFTAQDAEDVLGSRILPALKRLRDRSLLQRRGGCFRVLRPTRERFRGVPSAETQRAHAEWTASRALGADIDTLDADRLDLLCAHTWAAREDPDLAVTLASALARLLRKRGPAETLVATLRATPERAGVLADLARALESSGQRREAVAVAERAVAMERSFETLNCLGDLLIYTGRMAEARATLTEALVRAREGGPDQVASALQDLALADRYAGDAASAERRYREAYTVPHDNAALRAIIAGNLADHIAMSGRVGEALQLLEEQPRQAPRLEAQLLCARARCRRTLGRLEAALVALDTAWDLCRGSGWAKVQFVILKARMLLEGDLGLPGALATSEAALKLASDIGDPGQVLAVQARRPLLMLADGDDRESRALHDLILPAVLEETSPLYRTDMLYHLVVAATLRRDRDWQALAKHARDDAEEVGLVHVGEGLAELRQALSGSVHETLVARGQHSLQVRLALERGSEPSSD